MKVYYIKPNDNEHCLRVTYSKGGRQYPSAKVHYWMDHRGEWKIDYSARWETMEKVEHYIDQYIAGYLKSGWVKADKKPAFVD